MRRKIQKYLSGEREGFSLIELIIVIAIMAILIGVVALVVLPYLESSRESSSEACKDAKFYFAKDASKGFFVYISKDGSKPVEDSDGTAYSSVK